MSLTFTAVHAARLPQMLVTSWFQYFVMGEVEASDLY